MGLAFAVPASVPPVSGVRLAAVDAGLNAAARPDLALLEIARGAAVAAVFTQNKCCAAPVRIARRHLRAATPRYCLINSGNANAGTGRAGLDDALQSCRRIATGADCKEEQVLPFSTGVIGERLPLSRISEHARGLIAGLAPDNWFEAAEAIMTTDTRPKLASETITINSGEITLTGMAKGSGMIKPDMATMLAFVATDAAIAPGLLDRLLRRAVARSFNRITVDGDTSTNDACVLIATGQAANPLIASEDSAGYGQLDAALTRLMSRLARFIVRDGEGAGKFIEIEARGGETAEDCLAVAWSIAESPLVKTAFAAESPNWGRILAAIGKAPVAGIDIDRLSIYLGDLCLFRDGQAATGYEEREAAAIMAADEIKITVELGPGARGETVWTTDLSQEYIRINSAAKT